MKDFMILASLYILWYIKISIKYIKMKLYERRK